MTGYADTPLAKKLGIKEGSRLLLVQAPEHYLDLLAPLPDGVDFDREPGAATDIVHLFTASRAELEVFLAGWRGRLKPDGAIWVSWPKKASKVDTDVTEGVIRTVALPMGYIDTKVCAIDDTWSGLKLVVRKSLR